MNALRLGLIASLLAFATAHAAGDELPVETIVVTAKRPAFIAYGKTMLVVTVTAQAPAPAPTRAVPPVVTVSPEDSIVIEPPTTMPLIAAPRIELPGIDWPKLSIGPPRIELALADPAPAQG